MDGRTGENCSGQAGSHPISYFIWPSLKGSGSNSIKRGRMGREVCISWQANNDLSSADAQWGREGPRCFLWDVRVPENFTWIDILCFLFHSVTLFETRDTEMAWLLGHIERRRRTSSYRQPSRVRKTTTPNVTNFQSFNRCLLACHALLLVPNPPNEDLVCDRRYTLYTTNGLNGGKARFYGPI